MFCVSLWRQQHGSTSEALKWDVDRGEQLMGKGSPMVLCGRGDAEAVMPGTTASAGAHKLPGLNAGTTV